MRKLFNKIKNLKANKKGFTLIELVVSIGILAVLAGVMVPSLIVSANQARKDADDAAMSQLAQLHKAAIQEHETYHYFAQTVDKLADGEKNVYFWYESDEDGNVVFSAMNLKYPDDSTGPEQEQINQWAGQLKVKVKEYISGTYEIPQMQSRTNKSKTYIVCVSATNREFLVKSQGYWMLEDEP